MSATPTTALQWISTAHQQLAAGDAESASQTALAAIHADPHSGAAWQVYGLARERLGDMAATRTALEAATMLSPLLPDSQCALACCYVRSGQRELAALMLEHLAGRPDCPYRLRPRIAAVLGSLGRFGSALRVCLAAWRGDPASAELAFAIAYYLRRLRRPLAMVARALRKAVRLAPDRVRYRLALAETLAELGRQRDAARWLEPVDVAQIACPQCLRRMVEVFRAAGFVGSYDRCQRRLAELL